MPGYPDSFSSVLFASRFGSPADDEEWHSYGTLAAEDDASALRWNNAVHALIDHAQSLRFHGGIPLTHYDEDSIASQLREFLMPVPVPNFSERFR